MLSGTHAREQPHEKAPPASQWARFRRSKWSWNSISGFVTAALAKEHSFGTEWCAVIHVKNCGGGFGTGSWIEEVF